MDERRPPVMQQLQKLLPSTDWSFNYINGHAIVLEKSLE